MPKCREHFSFPDIEKCDACRRAYELVIERWYGIKAVENFRHNYQREILMLALRNI